MNHKFHINARSISCNNKTHIKISINTTYNIINMTSPQRISQSETLRDRKRRLNNERQAVHYRRKQTRQINDTTGHHELERMDQVCTPNFGWMKKISIAPKPHQFFCMLCWW